MAAPVKDISWLAWIERLVARPLEDSSSVPIAHASFYCRLDDQPDHLVPMQSGQWEGSAGRHLVFNAVNIFPAGEWPSSVQQEDVSNFCSQIPSVWIADPATEMLLPFWLGPRLACILRDLRAGEPAPSVLPQRLLHTLNQSNLFVTEDFANERIQRWRKHVDRCETEFQENGFTPIRGLMHPYHIAALRRYYRHRIRTGQILLGDGQCSRRYASYEDSVAKYFHRQLTTAVSSLVGEMVKPSYVYVASYQPGATLEKHVDREQCEFTLSLSIDYSPEPLGATAWPLLLHLPDRTVSVYQALGDGLLYRGRTIPHSRKPLPDRHTSTSIFFHYVPQDYEGPLN